MLLSSIETVVIVRDVYVASHEYVLLYNDAIDTGDMNAIRETNAIFNSKGWFKSLLPMVSDGFEAKVASGANTCSK
jgi:hypothetical protein